MKMARKKDVKPPIYLMFDDEFNAMKLKEDKDSFISGLTQASTSKPKKFSVTQAKSKKETSKKSRFDNDGNYDGDFTSLSDVDMSSIDTSKFSILSDAEWSSMMDEFDELSPIDDITYEDRLAYRNKRDAGDKYDQMFSKEQSMLNDLLSGLQKRSKQLDKKIDSLTGKSTYGIAKNFSDLVEASNTVEKTKLDTIKELVNIKKTATDLRIKDMKNNPDEAFEEDRDTIADRFYKSIISGKSNEFIQSSMGSYADMMSIDNNITQPSGFSNYGEDEYSSEDYNIPSYIKNETRNVQIYVCQHDNGTNEFIAIDNDGYVVEDYEVPSQQVLDSLSIKPGSNFAFDIYSRKYTLITDNDLGATTSNTDEEYDPLDDIEVESYDDDDKYNYANEAERDDVEDDNLYEDD